MGQAGLLLIQWCWKDHTGRVAPVNRTRCLCLHTLSTSCINLCERQLGFRFLPFPAIDSVSNFDAFCSRARPATTTRPGYTLLDVLAGRKNTGRVEGDSQGRFRHHADLQQRNGFEMPVTG